MRRKKGLSDLINREQRRHHKQQQQQQQQSNVKSSSSSSSSSTSLRKRLKVGRHTLMAESKVNILDAGLTSSKSEVDLHSCWARDGTPRWWIGKDYVNFIIKVYAIGRRELRVSVFSCVHGNIYISLWCLRPCFRQGRLMYFCINEMGKRPVSRSEIIFLKYI